MLDDNLIKHTLNDNQWRAPQLVDWFRNSGLLVCKCLLIWMSNHLSKGDGNGFGEGNSKLKEINFPYKLRICRYSINILNTYKLHLYKLQLLNHSSKDDSDVEMRNWFPTMLEEDLQLLSKLMFSEGGNF
ncbi:hypothetical protein Trydic_g3381 [Trypoxylus dichotomus]